MKREIRVYNDDLTITISTIGDGRYILHYSAFQSEFSETELKELQAMIEEIIQLANKQDY